MKKQQNIWINSSICCIFLLIPFIFSGLRADPQSILRNTLIVYGFITVIGIAFSLFLSRYLYHKVGVEIKMRLVALAVTLIIAYGLFIFILTMSNYNRMVSQAIDVDYFHQVVWQFAEFKIPYLYQFDQPLFAAWSQHFSPILMFIAPIYWFLPNATVLMVLQALVFLSGILPLYLIARRYLYSRFIGLSLSFAYIAFGGMQFGIAYGFHEIMFLPTIFFWMYYFYLGKKVKSYLLFVMLSLFVKEEVSFIMTFWGLYLLLFRKDKFLGVITTVLGIVWYFVCFNIVFPAFNPHSGGFGYWGQYSQSNGSGILGIIFFVFSHPSDFLKTLVTPGYKIDTIFQSFGSFGFLLFLFPPSILIVLPSLMEKLLSSNIAGMIGTHYSSALTGVTVVATIEALLVLVKKKYFIKFTTNASVFIAAALFYFALFFNVLYGYYMFSLTPNTYRTGYPEGTVMVDPSDNTLFVLSQVIDAISKNATVTAQYQIVPHLNHYYKLENEGPHDKETADYVLFDTQLPPPVLTDTQKLNNYLAELLQNKHYKLIVNNTGVILFKRIN